MVRPSFSGRRGIAGVLVAVGLAGAALAGCGADADDPWDDEERAAPAAALTSAVAPAPAGITWGACPPPAEGAARDPRLTCGTVRVPLDHRDPGGRTIDVAVSKLATAKPGERRGVLVLNPGGPALAGLDTPGTMAPTLPASVLDGYDLVGFDPRGVGNSTPQSCGLPDPSVAGFFPFPAADGSITANVDLARAVAERCASTAGADLRFFTTANTARDLDLVREALGEQKISYWGQSYGTYLGAVYNALFPDRADRVVLEGNVDPTEVWAGSAAGWGKGMAERFPDAAAVAAQDAALGLGDNVDEVTRTYLALADRLDRTPAPVPGTPLALSGAMLRSVTYGLLLDNETLPLLARFWSTAAHLADGTPTEADAAVLEQVFAAAPAAPGVPADNQATMFLALTCGDAEWSDDIDGYAARVAADRRAWPLTAGMPVGVWPCAFWSEPLEAPVAVTDDGPRNTLVLQNRRDNATPWDDGVALREVLGDRAGFVGVDNGGHYAYGHGSACADRATVDFLTTGTLPDEDVYCTDVAQR
ncbi:alpha/beta fold hydrolase [Pseudonocardia lacus]|uniref:alpha/beta fold hydrolase n=1 Tax=Pseudonocardia lacus TaxID=2835865 RepID=UPI0020276D23|nr:alpha/beta fold hydrolase [Pseudonocardia lacus]